MAMPPDLSVAILTALLCLCLLLLSLLLSVVLSRAGFCRADADNMRAGSTREVHITLQASDFTSSSTEAQHALAAAVGKALAAES